jgi:hypothetical protein
MATQLKLDEDQELQEPTGLAALAEALCFWK